jgi:Tfp pilus assembly protein PilO
MWRGENMNILITLLFVLIIISLGIFFLSLVKVSEADKTREDEEQLQWINKYIQEKSKGEK